MNISPKTTKRLAAGLERSLSRFDIEVSHGTSLDIVANLLGDRNWNAFVGKVDKNSQPSQDFFSARNILESLQDALILLGQTHDRGASCSVEDCDTCKMMDRIGATIRSYDQVYGAIDLPERDYWFVYTDNDNDRRTCSYIGKAANIQDANKRAGECGFTGEEKDWHIVDIDPIAHNMVIETFTIIAYDTAAAKELQTGRKDVIAKGLPFQEAKELTWEHECEYGLFVLESEQRNHREELNNCLNLTYYDTADDYRNGSLDKIEDGHFFRNRDIHDEVERELENYEVIVLSDLKGNQIEVFSRDGVEL